MSCDIDTIVVSDSQVFESKQEYLSSSGSEQPPNRVPCASLSFNSTPKERTLL